MKIKVIASGSKGNSTLIICDNTKILIDVGIPVSHISNSMKELGLSPNEIDGVLISHIHSDHTKGLPSLIKKYNLKVYAAPDLLYDLVNIIPLESIVVVDNEFFIDDVKITLLATSHDVISYGFVIEHNFKSLVYITDTGYINKKYYSVTKNRDIYVIEANHDEEMLMNGPYPYHLKQRVIGDKGHLSNHYTGKYLTKVVGDNTKFVFLAHISENNNTYDLALSQVEEEMSEINFDNNKFIVTHQNEESELVEV